jgi:hypothetical protein
MGTRLVVFFARGIVTVDRGNVTVAHGKETKDFTSH